MTQDRRNDQGRSRGARSYRSGDRHGFRKSADNDRRGQRRSDRGGARWGMEMARVLKAVMITVAVNVASTASTVNTVSGITARTIAKDGRRGAGSAMATGVILGRRSVHAFTSPSCPIMCSRQISRRPRVVSCEPWERLMRRRFRVTS